LVKAEPFKACGPLENAEEMKNKIVIAERGECMFNDKVRNKCEQNKMSDIKNKKQDV
jgi:hypothetical protein